MATNISTVLYASFSGGIDQGAVQRIIHNFSEATRKGATQIHLFFHSAGGAVGDGIALYSFFKSLPIDLTIYNPGIVGSPIVSFTNRVPRTPMFPVEGDGVIVPNCASCLVP